MLNFGCGKPPHDKVRSFWERILRILGKRKPAYAGYKTIWIFSV
ncbi:hypothetical protein PMCN06_2063 [Pasteurella multocida subsp. multocida str. HN06]|nr:hypothetical protein PMCN06_2063 [Pasteurella multocida subsp. multocida str. HN06]